MRPVPTAHPFPAALPVPATGLATYLSPLAACLPPAVTEWLWPLLPELTVGLRFATALIGFLLALTALAGRVSRRRNRWAPGRPASSRRRSRASRRHRS